MCFYWLEPVEDLVTKCIIVSQNALVLECLKCMDAAWACPVFVNLAVWYWYSCFAILFARWASIVSGASAAVCTSVYVGTLLHALLLNIFSILLTPGLMEFDWTAFSVKLTQFTVIWSCLVHIIGSNSKCHQSHQCHRCIGSMVAKRTACIWPPPEHQPASPYVLITLSWLVLLWSI